MKLIAIVTILGLLTVTSAAGPAQAKGCLKGAAVGGVAGHMAGHHTVLGAAAGCAVGHHEANKDTPSQAQNRNDNGARN
ncbi:MAG TPA: hypothetical protein VL614_05160 [Acetobacteraceae bacterium]|jgi:outer membrane lipoprotein SlyB|nr:hypothetical protein [Acetobacteraceae bacterium]